MWKTRSIIIVSTPVAFIFYMECMDEQLNSFESSDFVFTQKTSIVAIKSKVQSNIYLSFRLNNIQREKENKTFLTLMLIKKVLNSCFWRMSYLSEAKIIPYTQIFIAINSNYWSRYNHIIANTFVQEKHTQKYFWNRINAVKINRVQFGFQ